MDPTPVAGTLAAILADVTTFVTSAVGWMGDIVDAIVAEPFLMLGCITMLAGFGVGLIKRLIRL